MLPLEIWFIVWDYVMDGGPIALYRARDRIMYELMLENSPESAINITPQTARDAVKSKTDFKARKIHKPSLLPVL